MTPARRRAALAAYGASVLTAGTALALAVGPVVALLAAVAALAWAAGDALTRDDPPPPAPAPAPARAVAAKPDPRVVRLAAARRADTRARGDR